MSNNLKNYLVSLLTTIISIFLLLLLSTTLYYFNLISPTVYNILKITFLLLAFFVNSFILGKKAKCKGYLEGLKLSLPIIFIFIILTLIFTKSFNLKYLLYYLIILITSSFGGMVGISTKKEL